MGFFRNRSLAGLNCQHKSIKIFEEAGEFAEEGGFIKLDEETIGHCHRGGKKPSQIKKAVEHHQFTLSH